MSFPLVSVIIPCYNYGHLIHETLQSVLKQTYSSLECLVIDDGSTDDTAALVKLYTLKDKRIKYIHQQNGGQSKARNNGLKSASGKYIQFLDADDLIQDDKLKNQIAYLEANPDIDIVYSGVRYFKSDNLSELMYSRDGTNRNKFPCVSGSGHQILDYFLYSNPFELGSGLFRKSVIDFVGPFDESIKGVEDWDLCFRLAAANYSFYFLHLSNSNVLMRYHEASFSTSSARMTLAYHKLKQKMFHTIFDKNMLNILGDKERALLYFSKYMRELLNKRKYFRGLYHLFLLIKTTKQVKFYSTLYMKEIKLL